MIILLIIASFLPLLQCDNNTACFGTVETIDGISTFIIMYGDPDIYLQNFADGSYDQNFFYKIFTMANSSALRAITYDAGKEYVAISDILNGRLLIYRLSDLLGNSIPTAKYEFENVNSITALAFASSFNLLYFVYSNSFIGVIDFTKNRWIPLINNQTLNEKPFSIAVHEENRYLFWSDIGSKPKIIRSNLYGEERIAIVNSLMRPTNLVVDKQSGRLFWLDGDLKSSSFTGNDIVTYSVPYADFYSVFVIYKDIAMFSTSYGNGIYSYKISPNESKSLASFADGNITVIISASLDSKEFVKSVYNPCSSNPCEYMCIPKDTTGFICQCSVGDTLGCDGRTCIKNNNNLDRTSTIKNGGVSLELIGFKWMGFTFLAFKLRNLFG